VFNYSIFLELSSFLAVFLWALYRMLWQNQRKDLLVALQLPCLQPSPKITTGRCNKIFQASTCACWDS
jgi:hypothetical protein